MLRLPVLFGVLLCLSLVVARRGLRLSDKRRIFNKALDESRLRETKKLRSCWFDEGGNCCRNNVAGCNHYKSRSKQRGTSINFYYLPVYYGNFHYQSCNVQCWCTSYQPTCSSYTQAPATAAVTTTNAVVTTTTAAVTTTTAAATTTTVAITTVTTAAATTTATTATTTVTTTAATTTAATTAAVTTTAATTVAATTAAATTAAATTAAATTAITRTRFCPTTASTRSRFSRLFNGQNLNTCDQYPGVVTIFNPATKRVLCSGIMVSEQEVAIPNNCAKKITTRVQIKEPNTKGTSKVIQNYGPISALNKIPTGGKYIIKLVKKVSKFSCPGVACIYDDRMEQSVDISSCVVVANGYQGINGKTASYGFIKVSQFENTDTCPSKLSGSHINKGAYTYNCFNGRGKSTCEGDTGGAVMCKLSTDEMVVIGQIETSPCDGNAYVGLYNLDSDTLRVMKSKGSPIFLGIGRKSRKDISLGNSGSRRNSRGGIVLGLSKQNRGMKINKANRGLNLGIQNRKSRVQLGLSSKDKKVRQGNRNQIRELNLGKVNKGLRLGRKNGIKLGVSGSRGIKVGKGKSNRGINLRKKKQSRKVRLGKNKGQRSSGGKTIQLGVGAKKSLRLGQKNKSRQVSLGSSSGESRDKKRVTLGSGKTVKKTARKSGISLGKSDNVKQRAKLDLRAKGKTLGLVLG